VKYLNNFSELLTVSPGFVLGLFFCSLPKSEYVAAVPPLRESLGDSFCWGANLPCLLLRSTVAGSLDFAQCRGLKVETRPLISMLAMLTMLVRLVVFVISVWLTALYCLGKLVEQKVKQWLNNLRK
jgi:hypothetical protein